MEIQIKISIFGVSDGIPTCPVKQWDDWFELVPQNQAESESRPAFTQLMDVVVIVQKN